MKLFANNFFLNPNLNPQIAVAAIGAIGSVVGAGVSAYGSESAASTQAKAAQQAAALQQQQYQQNRTDQMPYMTSGTNALNTINQDQANGTGFATPFSLQSFMSNPAYQFQLQQGQNAVNSSAAATGGTLNGGTLKALQQYTTGLANQTYGDAYNRYLENSQNQYSQLFNVAQLGENATNSLSNSGTTLANNAGNYLTQAGNATASGTIGATNAINSGISGIGNAAQTYGLMQGLSSASSYNPGANNIAAANHGNLSTIQTPASGYLQY